MSLFAQIAAARETAQDDMAKLVELASKLNLEPILIEAIQSAAREFENEAR